MSDTVPRRHPEAQTMAAFVDGTLSRGEVAAVAEHLRGCGECRTVVSETAQFTDEEHVAQASARPWWMYIAAAIALAIAAVPIFMVLSRSPIDRLIASAPEHRMVEARLSGFGWARLQAPSRGEPKPDPADLKFNGAAGEVLDVTANKRDAASGHAKGVAYLVLGRRNDSITALERAANSSNDAKAWNDLAAARDASAVEDGHPSELPEALADVDHALRLDPHFAEALFNRALILEHLGILEKARNAWTAYLAVDPNSDWSAEARAHLHKLSGTSRRFDKKMIDDAPAEQLVREFPDEARRWAEGKLLPDRIDRARAIGDALAARNGEQLLRDAVRSVERTTGTDRESLIEAYRIYRSARMKYSRGRAGIAEPMFRRAAGVFRDHGSPMAAESLYYAASAAFDQHRAGAREELQQLLGSIESARYRALAADIEWQLAVVANAEGDWGEAARLADRGAATLHALGEERDAAWVDGVAAIAYEMMGERDLAWKKRASTFSDLSTVGAFQQLNTMLHTTTISLVPLDRIAAARALVDLIVGDKRNGPILQTESLATRARVSTRMNDTDTARCSIARARIAAAGIPDEAVAEPIDAFVDLGEAEIDANDAGRQAVAEVDRTLPLLSSGHLEHLLPDAYLQRGRAHRAMGDRAAAIADYRAALGEIERQDASIHDRERRRDFLDTAADVVNESVDLQLSIGDVSGALATVDRLRSSGTQTLLSAPKDVAIVEYLVGPKAVTLFCVSSDGISARNVAIDRRELGTEIDAFAEDIRGRRVPLDEIHRNGAALYQLLFEPVKRHVGSARNIVIVPDERLYAIPFAALWDDREDKYLVEQYVIRFATAAGGVAGTESTAISPALIISDPPAMHEPQLLASREEASRIAKLPGAVLLAGEMATKARFLELAPTSALIHFAGHANSDATQSYGALLFASGNGEPGVLSSSEIARLPLARHPLVVLAACGTFRGDAAHVSGMSSLARSFLTAGARGVVGTLWEIDDDVSARFFTRFHGFLRTGASPVRSLRDAQLDALRSNDPRMSHPATWSPVELLGNV